MKTEQATSPTLEEFKRVSREEYAFVNSYGFREVAPSATRYQNPYEVHFEKDGWRIVIVGFSYGFSADISIRSPEGRTASLGHLVPDDFRNAQRGDFGRGQLGDLGYCARCLKSFGQAFLRGEWAAFDELLRKQNAWIATNREVQQCDEREIKMERAIREAADAFRAGRYAEAVEELSPFEGFLPPAQGKKLTIARKRKDG